MEDEPCDVAIRQLYDYLHDELTDERRTLIRQHLDDCSPCLEVFDFEAELRVVISRRCQERVSIELRQRIAAAIGYVET